MGSETNTKSVFVDSLTPTSPQAPLPPADSTTTPEASAPAPVEASNPEQQPSADASPAESEAGTPPVETPKGHNFDAGLQKLQQKFAGLDSEIKTLKEQNTKLNDLLEKAQAQPRGATPEQAKKIGEVKAKIATTIAGLKNEAYADGEAIATAVGSAFDSVLEALDAGQAPNIDPKEISRIALDAIAEHEQRKATQAQVEQQVVQTIEAQHPALKGRVPEVIQQARLRFSELYEGVKFAKPEDAQAKFDRIFGELATTAPGSPGKPAPATPPASRPAPTPPPARTNPAATHGTQTVPDGARTFVPTDRRKARAGPVFVD